MRILYAKPLPCGNATRIILQPDDGETAWLILRRQDAEPDSPDDPAAFEVFYGGYTGDLIDTQLLVNGQVYHYAVFPRKDGIFLDVVRFDITPARNQRIYGDEAFLFLRERVDKYVAAAIADGELNPATGYIKVQVSPPIFEETAWPVVTLSLIQDRPEVRGIGDDIGGSARLADGSVGQVLTSAGGTSAPTWAAGGPGSGTSFPGSPATNDRYYRTDLKLECVYDGTRWVTVAEYAQPLYQRDALSPYSATASGVQHIAAPISQGAIWVERFEVTTYVSKPNSGTSYWTVQFTSVDGAVASTNLGSSFNTSADTAANYVTHAVTVGAVVATTARSISVNATKTSTPGNMHLMASIVYRRIVT